MRLLIGTNNKGKIIEIAQVLSDLPIEIKAPKDLGIVKMPSETGETFEENALQKARFYFDQSGCPTVADDSGIEVDALVGELGIHTRRWGAGPEASDEEWIAYFLKRMNGEKNRKARFVCALAYIDADGAVHGFRGTCEGVITRTLEADYLPGLPISACFKPDGCERVYSAMSIEQKNRTSHRGKAVHQLADFLRHQFK